MSKHALVVGVTGITGNNIAEELVRHGWKVTGLSRKPGLVIDGVDNVYADVMKPDELTDAIADLLLVSEPAGLANLAAEGAAAGRVIYVGNVMIDTLVHELAAARALDVPGRFALAKPCVGRALRHAAPITRLRHAPPPAAAAARRGGCRGGSG